jgi:hypothetical protein
MNKFKLLVIIAISFLACTKSESVLTLHEHIYSDGEFNLVKYANARWAVIPQQDNYKQEYMLLDALEKDVPFIVDYISNELGQYEYDHTTLPQDLVHNCMNEAVFFLAGGRSVDEGEAMYFWFTDEYTVRLFTYEGHGDMLPPYAVLSMFDIDKLQDICQ